MITFVTHFVQLSPIELEKINEIVSEFSKNATYYNPNPKELISLMMRSAKNTHPHAEFVILSDEKTQIEMQGVELFRRPRTPCDINFERVRIRAEFLKEYQKNRHIIFLDWDILIQKNLEHIFDQESSLILTHRKSKNLKCNDGVIGVHAKAKKEVAAFFDRTLAAYPYLGDPKFRRWLGFQRIIHEIIQPHIKTPGVNYFNFMNLKVCLLPDIIYNFSPIFLESLNCLCPHAAIIHFKGNRKKMMAAYFNKYLIPN